MPLLVASAVLGGVLAFAVRRPRGLPEAVLAVPAAVLVVVAGLVTVPQAVAEVRELGPTVGFLAAVLVLAYLAGEHGVFRYAGAVVARTARGRPTRLLPAVFVAASLTTAALSLDATVVLLTPIILAAAARLGCRPRPHVYATAHLANSASLLLPVSNLTNLLAFAASGLTFVGFAGLMALPWLAVIAVEYAVFRRFFRTDLRAPTAPPSAATGPEGAVPPGAVTPPIADEVPEVDSGSPGPDAASWPGAEPAPRYALTVLALTLAGFAVAQPIGVSPAWVAVAGALALAVPRRTSPAVLLRETNPAFCAFVLALGVVVLAVREQGLGTLVDGLVPQHPGLPALLATAALAALLANLVNNLPATLVLLPAVPVTGSPGPLLAVLIGVNVGPNLTYVGSLATLLWRQILHRRDAAPDGRAFLRLGLLTVPGTLVAGVVALWIALRLTGAG